jgi:hypothetical protein
MPIIKKVKITNKDISTDWPKNIIGKDHVFPRKNVYKFSRRTL